MNDILIILASFALAFTFTVITRNILLKRKLLDIPNERSSHKQAVPRGGGWALLAILIPGMIISCVLNDSLMHFGGVIAGTILLAAVSWYDDNKGASVPLRLSMHILAAYLGTLSFPANEMIFGGMLPFWLDRALTILGWAWFINLYNFMDGIDGITGVQTIAIAAGACYVFDAVGGKDPFISTLTLLLIGSCLGFLALNWHPAKIFLGDIGSIPLGYLTGFVLLMLALKGHLAAALILPLYYLADSGITIAKRIAKGEKIWQAHKQHFYQRAAAGYKRHDKVVYWIIAANIGLIAAALTTVAYEIIGLIFAVAIVAILLWKMHNS